jgi:hypothetical protein
MNEVREGDGGGVNIVLPINAKIEGTAVIKRADGSVKYEDDSLEGTYGEEHITNPE